VRFCVDHWLKGALSHLLAVLFGQSFSTLNPFILILQPCLASLSYRGRWWHLILKEVAVMVDSRSESSFQEFFLAELFFPLELLDMQLV
jgi:hypothetical protein